MHINDYQERIRHARARVCMCGYVVQGNPGIGAILILQIARCIRVNLMMNEKNIYTREKPR